MDDEQRSRLIAEYKKEMATYRGKNENARNRNSVIWKRHCKLFGDLITEMNRIKTDIENISSPSQLTYDSIMGYADPRHCFDNCERSFKAYDGPAMTWGVTSQSYSTYTREAEWYNNDIEDFENKRESIIGILGTYNGRAQEQQSWLNEEKTKKQSEWDAAHSNYQRNWSALMYLTGGTWK